MNWALPALPGSVSLGPEYGPDVPEGVRSCDPQQEAWKTREGKEDEGGGRVPGWAAGLGHYLLEAAAPHTVLPAPVRTLGGQAGCAVGQEVTGRGAGQWGRGLHWHRRHIQQRMAEASPVVGGLH